MNDDRLCPDHGLTATFDDEAGITVVCGGSPVEGRFTPAQALSAFDGQSITGVWTLTIDDALDGDVGVLHGWRLEMMVS